MTENEVIHAMGEVINRYGRPPVVLRCHPSVQAAVVSWATRDLGGHLGRFGDPEEVGSWPDGRAFTVPGSFDPRPGIMGLTLHVDKWMAPGGWRLCDDAMTVMYDWRCGKTLAEMTS